MKVQATYLKIFVLFMWSLHFILHYQTESILGNIWESKDNISLSEVFLIASIF